MKRPGLGLSFLPDAIDSELSARDYYAAALALSDMAEQAGFSFVKMTEHYLRGYGGYCPSPLAFLSAVAARTKRIRLMTGGILPVFHHPVSLASETAMVDAMSGGRLDVGFARGYLPYEFETFGIPMEESRPRFVATVEAVVELWSRRDVSIANNFFRYQSVTTLPRPTQQPHPPVWCAAVGSTESFIWIGEHGFGLLASSGVNGWRNVANAIRVYRESFRPGIHAKPTVALSLPVFVDETDQQAFSRGDHYLSNYLRTWADAASAWDGFSSSQYPKYTDMGRFLRSMTSSSFRTNGGAIVGSAARVADEIAQLHETLNLDYLLLQMEFGAMVADDSRRNLGQFIENVLPRL